MELFYIGLSVVALLAIWDSYLLSTVKTYIRGLVFKTGQPLLIYLFDCHYCKGFWMCVIGSILAGSWAYLLPSYGIVVLALSIQGEEHE